MHFRFDFGRYLGLGIDAKKINVGKYWKIDGAVLQN